MVIYVLSRSTSSKNVQSLPILDPKILRVDVCPLPRAPPPHRPPVCAIYYTYTVTATQLLSQLPCTISNERTKLHLTGSMTVSAALFCKQLKQISIKIPVTNNLEKWQSLGTPGISPFTLQYSLLLKKNVVSLYFLQVYSLISVF